jgi:tetratricopeptide (TPR) repeat protein
MHNHHRNRKAIKRIQGFLFVAFFLFPFLLPAQYDFNSECREAYKSILSLKFSDAANRLQAEKIKHPSNLVPVYLENYIDFLTSFIGENPAAYEGFLKSSEARLDLLAKRGKESPYYRYCLGNIRIQLAMCRIKSGEYKTAAFNVSKAYGELKENAKLYPQFLPQNTGLGLIHVLAGLMPENYTWGLKILGLEGNVRQGLSELNLVCTYSGEDETFRLFRLESLFYLTFLNSMVGKDGEHVLEILRKFESRQDGFPGPGNPLLAFAKATILSKRGFTDEAIQSLCLVHQDAADFHFYYLDYMIGLNKLNRLDADADLYFIRFIRNYSGRNYLKSAYQKLAWTFLLKGNTPKYTEYISKVLTRGTMAMEADAQADREARSGEIPNLLLLKARLLFDGGYLDRALGFLQAPDATRHLITKKDNLEYTYRLGRIMQMKGRSAEALDCYTKTIRDGADQSWYFAANAALQSGLIHEKNKDYKNAETYFLLCISMKNKEYKKSLDQNARLGLKRIKPYLP